MRLNVKSLIHGGHAVWGHPHHPPKVSPWTGEETLWISYDKYPRRWSDWWIQTTSEHNGGRLSACECYDRSSCPRLSWVTAAIKCSLVFLVMTALMSEIRIFSLTFSSSEAQIWSFWFLLTVKLRSAVLSHRLLLNPLFKQTFMFKLSPKAPHPPLSPCFSSPGCFFFLFLSQLHSSVSPASRPDDSTRDRPGL